MTLRRPWTAALALLLVATGLPGLASSAGAAPPAVPDQIRSQGASIYKTTVLGTAAVQLEVWSSTPARSIDLLLGGRVVATDTTVEAGAGYWFGTATLDLRGYPQGATALTMRVTTPTGAVRSASKPFVLDPVVAPLTPALLAARASAATTGVPAGTVLRPSGSLRITQPGTVVDGLDIRGCVVVAADDVTIRNSRIRCTTATRNRAVVMDGRRTGLLVERTEIDGGGVTEIGIDVSNVVLRGVNIHHVSDGVRMGGNVTVLDSWIHDLTRIGTAHPDCIQGISARDVVIRGNTLDPRGPGGRDLGNAAIQLGSERGASVNVLIEGNVMDGGNYTVNLGGTTGLVVRDNRFGTHARYGPLLTVRTSPVATGNVMDVTGAGIRVVTGR